MSLPQGPDSLEGRRGQRDTWVHEVKDQTEVGRVGNQTPGPGTEELLKGAGREPEPSTGEASESARGDKGMTNDDMDWDMERMNEQGELRNEEEEQAEPEVLQEEPQSPPVL